MSAVLLLLVSVTFAEPTPAADPIKDELDAARSLQAEKLEAARESFLKAIDDKLKATADKGDFKLAKEIKTQKELFEKEGTVPKAPAVARAKVVYEADLKAAHANLRKALEKAKKLYTQALKLDEAEAIEDELKEMADEAEAKKPIKKEAKESKPKKEDAFQVGTVWKGELTTTWEAKPVRTSTGRAELTVLERDGNKFKARIDLNSGAKIFEFDGAINRRGELAWSAAKTVLKQGQGVVFDTIGSVKGEYIQLRFAGINADKVNTYGVYKLELAK